MIIHRIFRVIMLWLIILNEKNTLYNKSDARIRASLYNVDIRIREY